MTEGSDADHSDQETARRPIAINDIASRQTPPSTEITTFQNLIPDRKDSLVYGP